nr:hypothetical protein [uncultured Caproiciproducens sp.]
MAKCESAYRFWNRQMRSVAGKERTKSRQPKKPVRNRGGRRS